MRAMPRHKRSSARGAVQERAAADGPAAAARARGSGSIRDVAERAGVSLGSASRVLNQAPTVTPELRERVERAIAELGYRPNHAARSLRLRSTRSIGCLLTDVANPLYGRLFHALEERLRSAGSLLLLANSLNNAEREVEILQTFGDRGMDGLIVAPGNEGHAGVQAALRALRRPTVILDRDLAVPGCDRLQFDHAAGVRDVVAQLVQQGHRAIGIVLGRAAIRPTRERLAGYRAGLAAHGLALRPELVLSLPDAMSSSYAEVRGMLQRPDRPSALLVLGTHILNEALSAIAALNLRIPQDISLVALGDPGFAAHYTPPLSALSLDVAQAADTVTRLLLERIQGQAGGRARQLQVPWHFVARDSCAPPV